MPDFEESMLAHPGRITDPELLRRMVSQVGVGSQQVDTVEKQRPATQLETARTEIDKRLSMLPIVLNNFAEAVGPVLSPPNPGGVVEMAGSANRHGDSDLLVWLAYVTDQLDEFSNRLTELTMRAESGPMSRTDRF